VHVAEFFQRGNRLAARKTLAVEFAVAGDLDLEMVERALTTETPTPCRPPEVS